MASATKYLENHKLGPLQLKQTGSLPADISRVWSAAARRPGPRSLRPPLLDRTEVGGRGLLRLVHHGRVARQVVAQAGDRGAGARGGVHGGRRHTGAGQVVALTRAQASPPVAELARVVGSYGKEDGIIKVKMNTFAGKKTRTD